MSPRKIPPRMIIYTRDIARLTGMSMRNAQRIMNKVRKAFDKSSEQLVTIEEFCTVMKMEKEYVMKYII
jgi:hypothetical protein